MNPGLGDDDTWERLRATWETERVEPPERRPPGSHRQAKSRRRRDRGGGSLVVAGLLAGLLAGVVLLILLNFGGSRPCPPGQHMGTARVVQGVTLRGCVNG